MSHDFEPTDAEKEMLSYMKDIEVNQKQTELGGIISGAILDGQNQIHDLYKEKATAQQIEYRMRRAYVYWMDRLNKANDHQLQKAREEAVLKGERRRIIEQIRAEERQKAREEERENINKWAQYTFAYQPSVLKEWEAMYYRMTHDHSELDQDKV